MLLPISKVNAFESYTDGSKIRLANLTSNDGDSKGELKNRAAKKIYAAAHLSQKQYLDTSLADKVKNAAKSSSSAKSSAAPFRYAQRSALSPHHSH